MSLALPVVDALLHPPFGFLRRELVPGIFSGRGDLNRPTGGEFPFQHVNAYGLRWSFFTVPPGFGYKLGEPLIYQQRMLELTVRYVDVDGFESDLEVLEAYAEQGFFWREPGPLLVHYEITPGVAVVFEWFVLRIL